MRRIATRIEGPALLEPEVHGDERGFFLESWRASDWAEAGIDRQWVQDNHSRSGRGVLRGMHFAVGRGQAKLVRCGRGSILDVLVDIRRGSPTYGEWEGFELTEDNHHQLYVPVGFAHGFLVTSDVADVLYKLDRYYDVTVERGIRWDDPDVGIEWPEGFELVLSERDRTAPLLRDLTDELPFTYP
jgi:dTDP-4-dehydrorhamnose 3,5-epimerase